MFVITTDDNYIYVCENQKVVDSLVQTLDAQELDFDIEETNDMVQIEPTFIHTVY